MSLFKNVIFDLDGLIVDSEPLHLRAFNAVLRTAGVAHQFDTAEYGKFITGHSGFEIAGYLRERFALMQSEAQISDAQRALFTLLIADAKNLKPMSGIEGLLAWLTAEKFCKGVASSTHPVQVQLVIRNLNLHDHFQAIVGNNGSMQPKPAPDVYLRALVQLGAHPNETLALEDSSSGVGAARAAGLFVIAIPNEFTRHQDFSNANRVMQDLFQVREFLKSPTSNF